MDGGHLFCGIIGFVTPPKKGGEGEPCLTATTLKPLTLQMGNNNSECLACAPDFAGNKHLANSPLLVAESKMNTNHLPRNTVLELLAPAPPDLGLWAECA